MLTLVPEGGLCNRMRAMASAIVVARMAQVPLKVLWYRTPDFNCAFSRLFSISGASCEIDERSSMTTVERGVVLAGEGLRSLGGWGVYRPKDTESKRFDLDAFTRELASRQKVYVRTNGQLIAAPGMFDCFRPTGEPSLRLGSLVARTSGAVGVHIRRTDNAKAISSSPLESFIELMDIEIARDASTFFFLATDSEQDIAELRHRFGERIVCYLKRAYRRDDPTAIEDAVVDLFGLAHCRKIIGSYWSSFTETAREIRQIDCVIAGRRA